MGFGVSMRIRPVKWGFGSPIILASPEWCMDTGGHSILGSIHSSALSLLSWGFCPHEIKITSSNSGTISIAKVGRRVSRSYGTPESCSFWSKTVFLESTLSGLLFSYHGLEPVLVVMPSWGGERFTGHTDALNKIEILSWKEEGAIMMTL